MAALDFLIVFLRGDRAAENVHLRAIKEHIKESNVGQQSVLFAFKNQYFIKGNPNLSA